MLYHERVGKTKHDANCVHIVYRLAKLCNIFDEAFFIDVSIVYGLTDALGTFTFNVQVSSKDPTGAKQPIGTGCWTISMNLALLSDVSKLLTICEKTLILTIGM